jgi:hypothetical protein
MPPEAGAAELQRWSVLEQLEALAALDAVTAARLLTLLAVERRQELVAMMEPHVAANIMQVRGAGLGGWGGLGGSVGLTGGGGAV